MIELFEDRPSISSEPHDPIFMKKGAYPLIRTIDGLGWLVFANHDRKNPQYTIIRFNKGREI